MPHRHALQLIQGSPERIEKWGKDNELTPTEVMVQIANHNRDGELTVPQIMALKEIYGTKAVNEGLAQIGQFEKIEPTFKLVMDKRGRAQAHDIKTGRFTRKD